MEGDGLQGPNAGCRGPGGRREKGVKRGRWGEGERWSDGARGMEGKGDGDEGREEENQVG